MLTLENVTKAYGSVTALSGFDCTIPTDQFVIVLGPSGSGKSTFLRIASFLELPTEGTVQLELDGKTYTSKDTERPWPILTCVFQKQFLWPHLTLRQNIELPLAELNKKERNDRVAEVENLLEMRDFIDRYPNQVSGGQSQRGSLARALCLRPKLLLIDEAHTGLDIEQRETVNHHLIRLNNSGVGIILVTHSIDFASRFSDSVLVIQDGRAVEFGTRSILNSPKSRFLLSVMSNIDINNADRNT